MEDAAPAPEAAAPAPVENSPAPAPVSAPASLLGGSPSEPVAAPVGDSPVAPATNQTPIEQSQSIEPWYNKHGDQYKSNPNITKYATEEGFLDGHLNLVKKFGSKGIEMPDENAGPEAWDAFYSKTGRPESVDKYSEYQQNITVDDAGNEVGHFEFDPDGLAMAKQKFFDNGMSDKQVQSAMQVYADITTQREQQVFQQVEKEAQHTEATLRQAYGPEFEAKMKSFNAVAESLGIRDDLVAMGLGNNLNAIRMLDTLTDKIGESKITGDVMPSAGGYDAQLTAIKNSPGFRDKGHPNYNNLQSQRIALDKAKYG